MSRKSSIMLGGKSVRRFSIFERHDEEKGTTSTREKHEEAESEMHAKGLNRHFGGSSRRKLTQVRAVTLTKIGSCAKRTKTVCVLSLYAWLTRVLSSVLARQRAVIFSDRVVRACASKRPSILSPTPSPPPVQRRRLKWCLRSEWLNRIKRRGFPVRIAFARERAMYVWNTYIRKLVGC